MKFTGDRPYSDPEIAARKLLEIANKAVRDLAIEERGCQCMTRTHVRPWTDEEILVLIRLCRPSRPCKSQTPCTARTRRYAAGQQSCAVKACWKARTPRGCDQSNPTRETSMTWRGIIAASTASPSLNSTQGLNATTSLRRSCIGRRPSPRGCAPGGLAAKRPEPVHR
jgi:hypothetical protein